MNLKNNVINCYIYFLFILIFIGLNYLDSGCGSIEPNNNDLKNFISLDLIDYSCTEAWVRVKTKNITFPILFTTRINNRAYGGGMLSANDTVIYINSFSPSNKNTIAISISSTFHPDSTSQIVFNSLDTTIENFSLELDTLGDTQSEVTGLWGTANNSLWAVGSFTTDGPTSFLAYFNGDTWEKLYPPAFYNEKGILGGDLEGIFGLNNECIWVVGFRKPYYDSTYAFVGNFNGSSWVNVSPSIPEVILNDVWASDNNNVWAVGSGGTILHYNGSNWVKQESGTNFILWDIDGISQRNIYVVGFSIDLDKGVVLHYDGTEWKTVDFFNGFGPMLSVCALSDHKIWIVGNTTATNFNGEKWNMLGLIEDNLRVVKGINYNDIFFGGYEGALKHFNGLNIGPIHNNMPWNGYTYINDIAVFKDRVFFAGRGGIGFDQRGLIYLLSNSLK